MMQRAGKQHRGFTLLELLVTLSVLSVVSTIGLTGLFRITMHWNDLQAIMSLNKAATLAFSSFADDFENTLSAAVSDTDFEGRHDETSGMVQHWRVVFEDDSIAFPVEIFNPVTEQHERMRIRYAIERTNHTTQLLRTAVALDEEDASRGNISVVATDIAGMRIRYYDGSNWHDHWDAPESPVLVRVSLSMMDQQRPDRQLARSATFPIHINSRNNL